MESVALFVFLFLLVYMVALFRRYLAKIQWEKDQEANLHARNTCWACGFDLPRRVEVLTRQSLDGEAALAAFSAWAKRYGRPQLSGRSGYDPLDDEHWKEWIGDEGLRRRRATSWRALGLRKYLAHLRIHGHPWLVEIGIEWGEPVTLDDERGRVCPKCGEVRNRERSIGEPLDHQIHFTP